MSELEQVSPLDQPFLSIDQGEGLGVVSTVGSGEMVITDLDDFFDHSLEYMPADMAKQYAAKFEAFAKQLREIE